MKKKLLWMAAATMLAAACTSESGPSTISYDELKAVEIVNAQVPVTFASVLGRDAVTRGPITTKESLITEGGFGVFAYYTQGEDYSDTAKPNFMYNQLVNSTDNGLTWTYAPIKYWPNQTQKDSENTSYNISTTKDKLSFFAYAPYVDINADGTITDPVTGQPKTYGITSITPANNGTGDVKIRYEATKSHAEDLMWGVAQNDTQWTGVDGSNTTIIAGTPFKDLVKPAIDTKIQFYFKHALTRLGLTVQAANNSTVAGGNELWGNDAGNKTKILIEKITIDRAIHTGGTLILNNTTAGKPYWEPQSLNAHAATEFVIDHTNGDLAPDLTYISGATAANQPEGVLTTREKSVLGTTNNAPDYFYLIPETTSPANTNITIVYHVITDDAKLDGGKSDIKNTITKSIGQLTLEQAKAYNIHIIIGMTSVNIDVSVEDWTDLGDTNANLPKNK